MQDNSYIEEFIDYVVADDESEEYDDSFPFGGIKYSAPEKAKKAYEKYIEIMKEAEKEGIKLLKD